MEAEGELAGQRRDFKIIMKRAVVVNGIERQDCTDQLLLAALCWHNTERFLNTGLGHGKS